VILLLLGCLALFASAYENGRRFDRSGSLSAQVRLDDSQFIAKGRTHIDDDDEGAAFGDVDHEVRIAAAIQAAVHLTTPTVTPSSPPYQLYRLRLATQSRPNTCVYPCGTGSLASAGVSPVQIGWLQGVRVIVNTTSGSFETLFDNTTTSCTPAGCGFANCQMCTISASLLNNTFGYTFTASLTRGSNAVTFVLGTAQGAPLAIASPLNITKLTVETQEANRANPRFGGSTFNVFSPTVGDFPNPQTGTSNNGILHATESLAQFGCTPAPIVGGNANFDGLSQADFAAINSSGHTSFAVTSSAANHFLVNSFGNASLTFTIAAINQVLPSDPAIASTYFQLGLENIPCTQRASFLYDEIAIVTGNISLIPELANPLANPTFYNALANSVRGATSNMASFLRAVRLIAGRTQIELFDAVLDRTPFSLLSHYSKFTPCFRVSPSASGEIGVFIGFGAKKAQKHPTVIFAFLQTNGTIFNATTNSFIPLSPDFTHRPQFTVQELELANLVNPNVTPAVQQPVTTLLSDVSILLDNCPAYTYFQ